MKIRLVHILTDIEAEREQASVSSLAPVARFGIEYVQSINVPYVGEKWRAQKNWANDIYPDHSQRHYGAFHSFRKAVLMNYEPVLDALILCECDCILTVTAKEFSEQVFKAVEFCEVNSLSYYTFGSNECSPVYYVDKDRPHSYITDKIICAHCVMFPNRERSFLLSEIAHRPWETPDVWFNMVFHTRGPSRFGAMYNPIAKQHPGYSLIDNEWKDNKYDEKTYL